MRMRYVIFIFVFLLSAGTWRSAYSVDFFTTLSRTATFDPNNLAKSCNVDFADLKDFEQQKQCFNFYKGVVNYYTNLNQQIVQTFTRDNLSVRNFNYNNKGNPASTSVIETKYLGMPPQPAITGGEIENPVADMPPQPALFGMPPQPALQ